MHLVLPFAAAASQAGAAALHSLRLPQLERQLARLEAGTQTDCGEDSLNLPFEHVLAACRGWPLADGRLPFAAAMALADGLPAAEGESGWGLLTPTHWQVGREQVELLDPAALVLGEAESQAIFAAVRGLFDSEGWRLHWVAPLRWVAQHESLRDLATASLDRVVGQAIDAWLPQRQAGRQVRRLQSEVQMLLHTHPINADREARGVLPVNSFWLSGTGPAPPPCSAADDPVVDDRLRAPALAGDWAAWVEAWHQLDAQRLPQLEAANASLTLCGPRRAQRFDAVPQRPWTRLTRGWRTVSCLPLLQSL
jgi:hypothetical protein